MRVAWIFLLGAACGAGAAMLAGLAMRLSSHRHHGSQEGIAASAGAHAEERFSFTAHARIGQVAPLFGADRERAWAPKWDPEFVYPLPVKDIRGMVFTVRHGHMKAAWVNTEFNPDEGRIQYVYAIPDTLITVITLQLTPMGNETHVEVGYDRTALSTEGIARVQHMAEQDRNAGPEWEKQVNTYLQSHKGL